MPEALPIRRVPRYVVALFFGGLLLLGAVLLPAYGTSWDEPADHLNGLVSLRYVAGRLAPAWVARHAEQFRNVPDLMGYPDNDHGVLFELPLAGLAVLRPGPDARDYYLLRHAAVFVVSVVGTWALYRLGRRHLRDERLGLLAAGLLVLSPRFFAESFYNGKDIVFTALFTVGAWVLARLLARPSTGRALVAGLATAAAADVRLLGLLLVPFALGLLGVRFWQEPAARPRLAGAALLYLLATAVAGVAGWPYLWADPVGHLQAAYASLSHYQWPGKVLYLGQELLAPDLPWHYPLVWLNVTTPLAYQAAALLGLAVALAGLARQPLARLRQPAGQLDALLLGWLLGPLVLVLGLHSILYDGWRHLYFIYPALLLLAVRGAQWLWQRRQRGGGWRRLALGAAALAGAEAATTATRMVLMHPQQQAYFSYLPGRAVEQLFERDYWGLSFRQGLEYLVAQQPQGPIYYDSSHLPPIENNKVWLKPADRARLVLAPGAAGRYFLSGYRHTASAYPDSVGQEVFRVRAGGVTILSVFRRERAGSAPPPSW
jgi:hypothetical protein